VPITAHRGAHQEAVAFLDDALGVAGFDMGMADDDYGTERIDPAGKQLTAVWTSNII
jgi:hypothetical protein